MTVISLQLVQCFVAVFPCISLLVYRAVQFTKDKKHKEAVELLQKHAACTANKEEAFASKFAIVQFLLVQGARKEAIDIVLSLGEAKYKPGIVSALVTLYLDQLTAILNSDEPSPFRIPMSISEPRIAKDKSDNPADAIDIAVNTKFFSKIEKSLLFRDFFLALIAEALNDRYNVQIKVDKAIILNNRKFIGTLVTHRVRNNDIKTILSSYQNPSDGDIKNLKVLQVSSAGHKTLMEEIDSKEFNALKKNLKNLSNKIRHRLRLSINYVLVSATTKSKKYKPNFIYLNV
ncbi:hypothetical protein GQX74_009343 [Glossina fuscipes]|nr:hypothetical protein GQX74_009343 [Glossina fuscipes]